MWLRQRSTAWCPSACHCRPPINEMPQRPGVSQKNIDRWNHRDFDCFCTLCRDQFWGPPGVGTGSQSAWRTHEPRRWATARLIHSWPKPTRVPCGRKPPGAGKVSASMRGYADSRQLHPTLGLVKRWLEREFLRAQRWPVQGPPPRLRRLWTRPRCAQSALYCSIAPAANRRASPAEGRRVG